MSYRSLPLADESWTPTSLSWGDALVFASLEEVFYAYVYDQQRSGLYVSTDLGTTWQLTRSGLPNDIHISSLLSDAGRLLVGTVEQGIFCRDKSGQRWQPAGAGLPRGDAITALAAYETMLMAGTRSCGLFRSDDGGTTWQPSSHGLPFEGRRLPILSLAATPDGLVAVHPLGLHRLNMEASSWQPLASPPPGAAALLGLCVAHQGRLLGWNGSGVYGSADAGTSWVALAVSLWRRRFVRSVTTVAGMLFVSTQGAHDDIVYRSTDGGATWERFDDGLPRPGAGINLASAGSYLLAGVGMHGIWRRVVAVEPEPLAFAPPFILEQNTPNPFHQTTRIRFVLHRQSHTVIAVRDVIGKKLVTLFDAVATIGEHELIFNGAGLPPGFYIYTLETNDMSQSRSMLLLR